MKRTLGARLLAGYALTVVAVLATLAVVLDRTLEAQFLDDLTASLAAEARAVRAALEEEPNLQAAAVELGRELDVRITVVRADGVVVADSTGDPSGFENHAGRPEVRAALQGRLGVATRVSASVGRPFRYVALPPRSGRIFRVALPLSIVAERVRSFRLLVASGTALAAIVGVAAVWLVGRGLTRPLRRMTVEVDRMSDDDLDVRVEPRDPVELALLAETLNRLASDLRARVESARRDRAELDQILASMDEGVLLVGREGVRYANPAVGRMLGRPPQSLRSLSPPALRAMVERALGGGHAHGEIETGVPTRILQAGAIPLAGDGEVLTVLRDVTAARRIEAMRRDFVADASHELKTPVASIQAGAETLQRALREDPRAAARFATRVRQDAERLASIVSDLLDLSRLESERPDMGPVRLDRVAVEEAERTRELAGQAGVEVHVHAEPVTVSGSDKDLRLMVANLLENAVRYTPRGGRVRLDVGPEGDHVELTLSDTGIGIPGRDLPRIFERFYRVDRARSRETGGTGLGLSIARHVAEEHGGRIEAESELGKGSTFRVILPVSGRRSGA